MKIFYFSCHAILEYDEVKLFKELGHDVFSAGAYSNPAGHPSLPRPSIPGMTHYPELERAASTIRATGGAIPQEIIDWADTVIFMHEPEILEKNWEKMKGKRVIFRSIGQCVGHQEQMLQKLVREGLEIVRYSPLEKNIPNFAGEKAMIRFYKDPEELKNWNGDTPRAINISQSIRQRADYCYYSEIAGGIRDVDHKIYGTGNEDLGEEWGGQLTYEELKGVLRDNRVYIYGGTIPASYTLAFIEAMMTGIPVVTISREITRAKFPHFDYFEADSLIRHGSSGFIGNNVEELRKYVQMLIDDQSLAKQISANGREAAIELFGRDKIAEEWQVFLG